MSLTPARASRSEPSPSIQPYGWEHLISLPTYRVKPVGKSPDRWVKPTDHQVKPPPTSGKTLPQIAIQTTDSNPQKPSAVYMHLQPHQW